ncbi:hypothetical protein SEVIR_9G370550v4 [Setaria viridis]
MRRSQSKQAGRRWPWGIEVKFQMFHNAVVILSCSSASRQCRPPHLAADSAPVEQPPTDSSRTPRHDNFLSNPDSFPSDEINSSAADLSLFRRPPSTPPRFGAAGGGVHGDPV